MGTAYLDVTITLEEGGIILCECEPVAEIEYVLEDGELSGWHVSDFRFDQYSWFSRPGVGKPEKRKTGEAWCPDDFRAVLVRYLDKTALEEALFEYLYEAGELRTETSASLSADYHAGVL